jgi:hypothetical protein
MGFARGVQVVDNRYALRGPLVFRAITPQDQMAPMVSVSDQGYRPIADFVNRLASTAVPVDIATTLNERSHGQETDWMLAKPSRIHG